LSARSIAGAFALNRKRWQEVDRWVIEVFEINIVIFILHYGPCKSGKPLTSMAFLRYGI